MTIAQIMRQALLMLGEDEEDYGEFRERFLAYANMGYRIAIDEYVKPREMRRLSVHHDGIAHIDGEEILRVVEVKDFPTGNPVPFAVMPDGKSICVHTRRSEVVALCEVHMPDMVEDSDEPRLTNAAQAALCDYICYRHLSSGNLAKQSRAQFFRQSFYEAMSKIRPEGFGSVTRERGLYAATDIRS